MRPLTVSDSGGDLSRGNVDEQFDWPDYERLWITGKTITGQDYR